MITTFFTFAGIPPDESQSAVRCERHDMGVIAAERCQEERRCFHCNCARARALRVHLFVRPGCRYGARHRAKIAEAAK